MPGVDPTEFCVVRCLDQVGVEVQATSDFLGSEPSRGLGCDGGNRLATEPVKRGWKARIQRTAAPS